MNTNIHPRSVMRAPARARALAVAAGALLALPAGATAHLDATVHTVQSHTEKADAGLERAADLFDAARDRKAARAFTRSRRQMGKAKAEAAKLRRGAESESDRAEAAQARAIVASQQDENVEDLVGMLDEADGRVENKVAKAALSDTRGREKAIAVLTALMGEVPVEAQEGIARALGELSVDRSGEVRDEARALSSDDVSKRNKRRVGKSVETSVEGQQSAADTLAELIASEDTHDAARPGLQTAYDAVTGDQERLANVLSRFSDRMPASIREFVAQIVEQALTNAQEMGENRPEPPAGAGQPESTPTGQPDGVPVF